MLILRVSSIWLPTGSLGSMPMKHFVSLLGNQHSASMQGSFVADCNREPEKPVHPTQQLSIAEVALFRAVGKFLSRALRPLALGDHVIGGVEFLNRLCKFAAFHSRTERYGRLATSISL